MSKIKLVRLPRYICAFEQSFIIDIFTPFFEFEPYDPTTTYDKQSTIFLKQYGHNEEIAQRLSDDGHKIVVEEIWEYPRQHPLYYTIINPKWFWYNECLWYYEKGYQHYLPNKTYGHLAFMPINRVKEFRNRVIERLEPLLDQMIWSYGQDKRLPGDCDHSKIGYWQRYLNPRWYDDTYFSVVVESMTDGCFITEKTMKPLAYQHPFLVIGPYGTLSTLRSWGFQTFGNIFDESYDDIDYSFDERLSSIIRCIEDFSTVLYDRETSDKIEHNKNLFWNKDFVIAKIRNEIIVPLIEYANQ